MEFLFLDGIYGLELFWVAAVVVVGLLAALARWESWGWATLVIMGALAGLRAAGLVDVIHGAAAHPLAAVLWVAGYVLAGILWAALNWYDLSRTALAQLRAARLKYAAEDHTMEFERWLALWGGYDRELVARVNKGPLKFADYRETIAVWIYLWPFSLLNKIVGQLPVRVYNAVNRAIAGLFDRIAADIWERAVLKNIATPKPK